MVLRRDPRSPALVERSLYELGIRWWPLRRATRTQYCSGVRFLHDLNLHALRPQSSSFAWATGT